MLNSHWILNLTSLMTANLNGMAADYAQASEGPITEILARLDGEAKPAVDVSYGWVKFDGLPTEALQWDEVDAECLYIIKVSNRNDRPIGDDGLEFVEMLPEGVSIAGVDFDGSGPLETSFEFYAQNSGIILLPEDISYSDDDGENFAYRPDKGEYDEAIGAIRVRPKGMMAPNSSFVIRFRAMVR